DEDVGLVLGDLLHGAEYRLHRRALADHAAEGPGPGRTGDPLGEDAPQGLILPSETLAFLGLAKDEQHLVRLEGLADVVVGPALHRLERQVVGAVGRHDDYSRHWAAAPELVEEVEPGGPGHPDVADQAIVGAGLELGEGGVGARGRDDVVALTG